MEWDWQQVQKWLKQTQRTGVMPEALVPIARCWIESVVSQYGADLDRDDTSQALWVFMIESVIPKLKVKLPWHGFILLCLRQEIYRIKKRKLKESREQTNVEEIENGEDVHSYRNR